MVANLPQGQHVEPKAKIFVSYSRKDMIFADRLDAALKARGFETLIDREEIYAFEDWWKRLQTLIGSADTVVFLLSPDAVASREALREVEYAASLNKRFAPIVCRRVEDSAIPEPLRRLNFIFFDDPEHFDAGADRLAEALQTDIGWIRQHTEYGEAARRWSAAGRPGGLLLHSPTLEVAEHWIGFRPRGAPEPTEGIRIFVAESRRAAQSARRRQQRVRASIYTLLVGIIVGLVGWINQMYIEKQWRWYATQRPFVAANIWPHVLSGSIEHALQPQGKFRECAIVQGKDYCPEMVVIPAGSFTMGSVPASLDDLSEAPQHTVTIAKPVAISKLELTFDEWDTCATYGDCRPGISAAQGDRGQQPVINVTWDDAQTFVAWLSLMTGKPYRLLTEAEYEYAVRGGTDTEYPWGNEIGKGNANCRGCGGQWDGRGTAPVGSFAANGFGLYDMVGNVWEWVEDCDHSNYFNAPTDGTAWLEDPRCKDRVVRGGSWFNSPVTVRSANRGSGSADFASPNLGFRIARTLDVR